MFSTKKYSCFRSLNDLIIDSFPIDVLRNTYWPPNITTYTSIGMDIRVNYLRSHYTNPLAYYGGTFLFNVGYWTLCVIDYLDGMPKLLIIIGYAGFYKINFLLKHSVYVVASIILTSRIREIKATKLLNKFLKGVENFEQRIHEIENSDSGNKLSLVIEVEQDFIKFLLKNKSDFIA